MAATLAAAGAAHALVPFGNVAKIAGSFARTCAVTLDGAAYCWGPGPVGDNTAERRNVPVAVAGLSSGVADIATGTLHSCAVLSSGNVRCWGRNDQGQVGLAGTATYFVPADVPGIVDVKAIAAGDTASCALTQAGAVKCWGLIKFVTGAGPGAPYDVPELSSGVVEIAMGRNHACALTVAGGVKCWGDNINGQLGNMASNPVGAPVTTPVDVIGLGSGVAHIAAADNSTCALMASGAVKCWGRAWSPLVAVPDVVNYYDPTPVDIAGFGAGVTSIAMGDFHLCGIFTGGAVGCTGENASGQLGDGTDVDRTMPVAPAGLGAGVTSIHAGLRYTCAIQGGMAKCWGNNELSQLGDNFISASPVPVDAEFPAGAVAFDGGSFGMGVFPVGPFSCFLTAAGGVKCAGANANGELGDGTRLSRGTAVDVVGLTSGVLAISSSNQATCALTSAGAVKCWGMAGGAQEVPAQVPGLESGVTAISLGFGSICGLFTSPTAVRCHALGSGEGLITVHSGSVQGFAAVQYANGHETCVIDSLGRLQCINNGSVTLIEGFTDTVTSIVAGLAHKCALTAGGAVKCWGTNAQGQLGRGTQTNDNTHIAQDVIGISSGAVAITAGHRYTCALMADGTARCWGQNEVGQLGDGTSGTTRPSPVSVVGLTGAQAIFSGGGFTCATTTTGPKCWGFNAGQFGFGRAERRYVPGPVLIAHDAELSITTTLAAGPVGVGRDLVYNIGVLNSGPNSAGGVAATQSIPAGATVAWSSPGCVVTGGSVSCALGTITSGASGSARVVLRPAAPGSFATTSTIVPNHVDPTTGNNSVTIDTAIGAAPAAIPVPRYRLYSAVTLEHHFTTDLNEYTVLGASGNWAQEGTVGKVLDNPGSFNGVQAVPYYRLYDTATRWHHWTTDANEYYTLTGLPHWNAEGVDGFILPTNTAGATELYRLTYPFIPGLHHWTIDPVEYGELIGKFGWIGEPGAGFVVQ